MAMNTRNWTLLLDAIAQKRVVIVLGADLFTVVDDSGARMNVTEYVKQKLLQKFPPRFADPGEEVDFSTIEEQIELWNFMNRGNSENTNIYYEIFHLLRGKKIECRESIRRLLAQDRFPLVISTTYLQQLPEILGIPDERVFCYKKSATNEINNASFSSREPSLFYMFGRANSLSKSYMVTEEDYLDYLHHWHNSEFRPQGLCRYLSDKFLLVLGCNYPNWIFRFFWHSIRNFQLPSHSSSDTEGVVSLENSDDHALRRFLARIQAVVCNDMDSFVEELIDKCGAAIAEPRPAEAPEQPSDVDVFISYANEDYEVAKTIAGIFTQRGAKVWFDKKELHPGNEYEMIIKDEIIHAKRFVPIISTHSLVEQRRFFRKEWTLALGEKAFRLNMEYIIPVRIDDFPIDSLLLPEEFKQAHFLNYTETQDSFEQEVVNVIRRIRR